jgi:hypothetical protein
MSYYGSDDADEIDVVAFDYAAPVVCDVGNVEFTRHLFGMFAMRTGNYDAARAFAVLEARDLRRLGKPGANDSDSNRVLHLPDISTVFAKSLALATPRVFRLYCPNQPRT